MTEETPQQRRAARDGRTGLAAQRQAFLAQRLAGVDFAALFNAVAGQIASVLGSISTLPVSNDRRWVPIGPSIIQAQPTRPYPRSTGRVRDVAVDATGRRAYAASGQGGLWYTEDGGMFWSPVGGFATRPRAGGTSNAQSIGCLLVTFGSTAADDFVMVGTGEQQGWGRPPNRPALAGTGVLVSLGPAAPTPAGPTGPPPTVPRVNPWEPESGAALFNGLGVFRIARRPGVIPGRTSGSQQDLVVAATTAGLFLGTRQPAPTTVGGDEFSWVELTALGPFLGLTGTTKPLCTEVAWVPGGADGRILVAVAPDQEGPTTRASVGAGVAYSDDRGAHWHWVTGLNPRVAGLRAVGRMSFALAEDVRLYVLGDTQPGSPPATATIWQIPAVGTASPPVASRLTGVPAVWFDLNRSQRDYDQALAVDVIPGAPPTDRLYFAGNFVDSPRPTNPSSVWCFDVTAALALNPVNGISQTGPPPAGANAFVAGLVGDNVHADVHVIRLAGAAPHRQVWVGCDGGVYLSTEAGRVNTFAPRSTGIAAVEVNFLASHPTSSHFVAAGMQDNGRELRVGDVVWIDTMGGDGGGVAIDPVNHDIIVSQFSFSAWGCEPTGIFAAPTNRRLDRGGGGRESNPDVCSFYTGMAAVARTASDSRLTIGTNRVWLTDDLGVATPNTWQALPFPSGPVSDPRPAGADPPATWGVGVPGGGPLAGVRAGRGPLGAVVTQKWASATELLVLFANGVVRWTETGAGVWSADVLVAPAGVTLSPPTRGAPDPARNMLTDLCPVPTTHDFYLTTTGDTGTAPGDTCFFFDNATRTFQPTLLRHQLNSPPPPATSPPATLGPRDPAFAVVVDPASTGDVYVGTVTGVWHGVRGTPYTWTLDINGLPQALVQDLNIWRDPAGAPDSPRLLRAAMQSRGVWELNLAPPREPERTYVRVHPFDDRRHQVTPMANPRRRAGSPPEPAHASPDIVVRPQAGPATAPVWPAPVVGFIDAANPLPYQIWTFQTAFRWIFPTVIANGFWSDAFGQLVQLHRSNVPALAPVEEKINQAVWDAVVGGTRINATTGALSSSPTDPLAVYRAPWHTPAAMAASATEIDLMECVVVPTVVAGVQQAFKERSTVDVLIHHRDTRPLAPNSPFVLLLWREGSTESAVQNVDVTPIPTYIRDVIAAETSGSALPTRPSNWNLVPFSSTRVLHRLNVRLDARMPRAVSIDVDLSGVRTANNFVLFLAVVGSAADPCTVAPFSLPATPHPEDLVTRWPYAAMRLLRVVPR